MKGGGKRRRQVEKKSMTATIEISSNCYRVTPAISLFSVNCVSHTGEGLGKSSRERESKEGTLLFLKKIT